MLIEEHLDLPRFSSNLRAFSTISDQLEEESDLNHEKKLINKRKQLIQNKEKKISWDNVLHKLTPTNTIQKTAKLKAHLDKLRTTLAKQFLNEDFNDTALLNEAALFLLENFYEFRNTVGSGQSNFQNLDKLSKKLREKFGQFPRNVFDNCKDLMEHIFNEVNSLNKQSQLNDLFAHNYVDLLENHACKIESADTKYFGDNIKFYSFYANKIKELKSSASENYESSSSESDEYFSDDEDEQSEEDEIEDSFQIDFSSNAADDRLTDDLKMVEWTKHFSSELCTIVYELLSKNNDINQIQNELVELLGFEKIEIVEFLLSNKNSVVKAYETYMKEERKTNTTRTNLAKSSTISKPNTNSQSGALSSQIVVHTETEKKIKKLIRKEEKRMNKANATKLESEFGENFDPSMLRKLREEQLTEARILQLYNQKRMNSLIPENLVKKADQYPFVFDSLLKITQSTAFIAGSKILLPENIKRTDTHVYEEVFIPPSDSFTTANPKDYVGTKEAICFDPLVKTSSLDEIGQLVFRNVKSLNRIQSIVFDSAYNTNENLLICAPTGAGKTNIALLTIVNQIKKNIVNGVLKRDDFKIVYIAPMKALAAEMVANFSTRLAPLGIVVKELTGDIQLTKQEIMETQMLVATPEKWDVVTRKSLGDISLSLLVRLLIIDEVHLLHDDRGSVIETIVARTLRQVESSQKMIRIVGLSATLPNYLDVARFLNVNPKSGLFFFDSRFRPVPLAQTFIGVKALNKMKQQEQMDEVCYDKALKMVRQGHQVMVFVHARNATIKTALKLREMAKHQGESEFFRPEQSKEYGESQRQMQRSKNKQLREVK